MAVTSTTATTLTGGATQSSLNRTTLSSDDFYKLLVAEMKYQDPMNPMKDSDFIAQTAQFSSLDESRKMTTLLTQIADVLGQSPVLGYASVIGKYARVSTGDSQISGQITSVATENGTVYLTVNGSRVKASDVTEISQGV
jgi:flagellar basal-body rod modification protein FlgD